MTTTFKLKDEVKLVSEIEFLKKHKAKTQRKIDKLKNILKTKIRR